MREEDGVGCSAADLLCAYIPHSPRAAALSRPVCDLLPSLANSRHHLALPQARLTWFIRVSILTSKSSSKFRCYLTILLSWSNAGLRWVFVSWESGVLGKDVVPPGLSSGLMNPGCISSVYPPEPGAQRLSTAPMSPQYKAALVT